MKPARPDPGVVNFDFYAALLDAAPDAMLAIDTDGLIVLANQRCRTVLGWDPAALVGQPVEALLPADLRALHAEHRRSFARDPRPRPMESGLSITFERPDGARVPITIALSQFTTPDGPRFVASIRDITPTRQAERDAETTALRLKERQFRISVEQLHEALSVFVAIRDREGRIEDFRWTFANKAASAIAGYTSSELEGRRLLEVLPGHELSGMLDVYKRVVETGAPYVEPALEFEDVWGDGRRRRRVFDVRASKLDDGFVVVTREITEQREQELELRRRGAELERTSREAAIINNFADLLQGCETPNEVYDVVEHVCPTLFERHDGAVSILGSARDQLAVQARFGSGVADMDEFAPGACWALRRGRPHHSGRTGLRCAHLAEDSVGYCVPLIGQTETIGAMHLGQPAVGGIDALLDVAAGAVADVWGLAATVAGQLAMAIANIRLRDSLRSLAIRDPLTGLYNRRYLDETMAREISRSFRDGSDISVISLDIDNFKVFNDTHGHDAGDAVMEAVGQLLVASCRTSDVACRLGGEEFLVILPGCPPDEGRRRAEEISRSIAALRVRPGPDRLPSVTVSCGVAAFPVHGTTTEELLKAADQAMYSAKRAGRNQIVSAAEPAA